MHCHRKPHAGQVRRNKQVYLGQVQRNYARLLNVLWFTSAKYLWSVYFQSDHILYLSWGMDWPIVLYQIIALHFFSVQNIHHIRHTRQKCSVRVPIRPFTTSSALLFTFPLFDVETTWGILNDISITPASDMRLV